MNVTFARLRPSQQFEVTEDKAATIESATKAIVEG